MFKAKVNEILDKSPKGTLNSGSDEAESFVRIDVPIDVPIDDSCLFWAVAFACLIPVKDRPSLFRERCEGLFGEYQESVRELILGDAFYNELLHKKKLQDHEILKDLVRNKFRSKVVNYMQNNPNDFEDDIKNDQVDSKRDFNAYLDYMRNSTSWGGEIEVKAMSKMLGIDINLFSRGKTYHFSEKDCGAQIRLFHVNTIDGKKDENHYKFGLEKSIIDNYIKSKPKKSSPLKDIGNSPLGQDSTPHQESPGKENTPPSSSNEKQVSSITDEEVRSSSSRKRKLISSVISEGTIGEDGGSSLAKRVRIEGNDELLEVFVESFVEDFESMLKDCLTEVKGKKEKKPAMLLQLVSLGLVGGVVGAGVSMAGAGVVAAPIIVSTALLTKKAVDDIAVGLSQVAHSNGAASVVKTTSNLQVSQSQMRKMVVEAGVNIFLHYSSQYKNITCKAGNSVGMEILAQNAAARVIDYIKSQERAIQVEDPEVFLREFCTLMTKGVALGSKREMFVRLGKYMKKTTQTALERIVRNQPLFALKNEDSDVKDLDVDDIYEKTGIVKITNDGNQYYVSKESDAGNYGYRIMFEWESKSELDGWEKQECPSQEWCGYTLKSEEIEKRVNEILKKLNDKGQALRADTGAIKDDTEIIRADIGAIKADTKAILNFCMEGNLTLHTKRLRKSKLKEVVSDLDSFLQLILKYDKVESLEFLIREGFNDKIKDDAGYDLLQLAAKRDAIKVMQFLINDREFDCKVKDDVGDDLLQLAAESDAMKVMQFLINDREFDYKVKDKYGYNLLQLAVEGDAIKVMKHLIKEYSDHFNYKVKDNCEYNLLQLAAVNDSIEILKYLIEKYGDYFGCEIGGNGWYNLLQLAIEGDSIKVLKCLIENEKFGYKIRDKEEYYYLLQLAIKNDSIKVLKCLIENEKFGYKIRDKEEYYYLLQLATKNDSIKVLKCLIENEKFDYEITNQKRYDLLRSATQDDSIKVLEYLIREKKNFNYKIGKQRRRDLLQCAVESGSIKVLKYLIEEGKFGYEIGEEEYYLLLELAVKNDLVEILKYLMEEGIFDYEIGYDKKCHFLYLAAQNGHLEIVEFLVVVAGTDVDAKYGGSTPLHLAAQNGHLEIVKFLVENNANKYAADFYELTPLYLAAQNGHLEIVKFLVVVAGVDVDSKYEELTPLHLAAQNGHLEVVEFLVNIQARIDARATIDLTTPLHLAIIGGKVDTVLFLINNGADINAEDVSGATPVMLASHYSSKVGPQVLELLKEKQYACAKSLFAAARKGNLDGVKYFINSGVDVNAKNKGGLSSLHLASQDGHLEVVNFLVGRGAHIDAQDNEGYTSLHLAAENGYQEVVQILVDNNADVDVQDNEGYTPLSLALLNDYLKIGEFLVNEEANIKCASPYLPMPEFLKKKLSENNDSLLCAAKKGKLDEVRYLLNRGAQVDVEDGIMRTPLHLAAQNNHLNIIRFLISKGGDINGRDASKRTPLHLAAQDGCINVVEFLASKVDINITDNYKWTPLHLAARGGHLKVVKFLVGKKANINVGNINQYTPLHLAAKNGHVKVVKVLLENGADHNIIDEDGKTPLDLAREKLSKNQKNSKLGEVIDLLSKQIEYHSNVSQSESELSRKADSSPEAFLSDSIVCKQMQMSR